MKRIIRLTESDLNRIVRRVIMENEMEIKSLEVELEKADENNPPETLIQKLLNLYNEMGDKLQDKLSSHLRKKAERLRNRHLKKLSDTKYRRIG